MKLKKTKDRRKSSVMKPKTTLRSSKERRQIFLTKVWISLFAVMVLGATLAVSIIYFRNILFVKNPRYTIKNINVHSSGSFSLTKFKDYAKIEEGDNIYSFDLGEVEEIFSYKTPNVKDIKIRRILPDSLEVRVLERTPVMRIARRTNLCVDEEGYIFLVPPAKARTLPYILGLAEYVRLRPGGKLTGRALSAVKLVLIGSSSKLNLPISMVNMNEEDYLLVMLSNGRQLKIAWEGMDDNTEDSIEALRKKLVRFVMVLQSSAGRSKHSFEAIDDKIYGR